MLLIYYNFNSCSQPFLTDLVLPAISLPSTMYSLVALLYLTPVVKFTSCSFEHFALACSILVFYRRNLESFLTQSSATHKTLNFSKHTDNIACRVICWSLSLWRVWLSWWSLSLLSVQCSLYSLSLWSIQCLSCTLSLILTLLCSGNARPQSPYSLTSNRCSRQSLLPFQHSALPKIHQWMSTAIKQQPSLHLRCCSLNPKLLQNFPVTALSSLAPLQTCQHIYIMLYNVPP